MAEMIQIRCGTNPSFSIADCWKNISSSAARLLFFCDVFSINADPLADFLDIREIYFPVYSPFLRSKQERYVVPFRCARHKQDPKASWGFPSRLKAPDAKEPWTASEF
jgi:hypothetical protein